MEWADMAESAVFASMAWRSLMLWYAFALSSSTVAARDYGPKHRFETHASHMHVSQRGKACGRSQNAATMHIQTAHLTMQASRMHVRNAAKTQTLRR